MAETSTRIDNPWREPKLTYQDGEQSDTVVSESFPEVK
jgi:hypothetical protein